MTNNPKNAVILTVGLTKIFRDFWGRQKVVAVDSLDLEIYPQEVFGLLGPNGSGKSTTIKMLLGLLYSTRGSASVLGQPPGDVKTNSRIGYLPEESYLYPFLNARETLDFYGRLFSLSYQQRKQRIDSLLDMVGLIGVSRRPVGQFSKGMTRRIGLAQALINDPDLLILDEPTSGLDPLGTRQIKDLICQLGKRGKTVLLCSHLLADVEDVCSRIGILYGGKMQQQGKVNDLLTRSELTQISSGQLSDQCLEKIKTVIHADHPEYDVDVHCPTDRLEDYFLRTVAQAQIAETETSGAIIGSGISDFLTTSTPIDESETVIAQLVTGRQQHEPDQQPPPTEQVNVVPIQQDSTDKDLIDSLTATDTTSVAPKTQEPDVTPVDIVPETEETVDRSVIDNLLTDKEQNKEK